jgi:hypothetical protein
VTALAWWSVAVGCSLLAVLAAAGLLAIGAGWRAARPRLVEADRTPVDDDEDLMAVWTSTQDGAR